MGPASPLTPQGRAPDRAGRALSLPRTVEEQVATAAAAVLTAYRDGVRTQIVELLLPAPGVALRGSVELGIWPGGIQQQFKVALPMVQALLQNVKRSDPSLAGRMVPSFIDESDAVASWAGPTFTAVLFPTGDALPEVRRSLASVSDSSGLGLLVNPQWVLTGNLFSEFSFGARGKENEEFVSGLGEETYYLAQKRIAGRTLRVFRSYPGRWFVFTFDEVRGKTAEPLLLSVEEHKPGYGRLAELAEESRRLYPEGSWLRRVMGDKGGGKGG